jgi:hypothetical protein
VLNDHFRLSSPERPTQGSALVLPYTTCVRSQTEDGGWIHGPRDLTLRAELYCYTDRVRNFRGVTKLSMPQRKKLPYKVLIGRLIDSKRLSSSEQAAFEAMQRGLEAGHELTEHERLWVESLRVRTDPT